MGMMGGLGMRMGLGGLGGLTQSQSQQMQHQSQSQYTHQSQTQSQSQLDTLSLSGLSGLSQDLDFKSQSLASQDTMPLSQDSSFRYSDYGS